MKSLLVALLVANGMCAGWVAFAPPTSVPNARDPMPPLEAATIHLVSERAELSARTEIVEIREPHAAPQSNVEAVAATPASFSRECRAWGPFERRTDAEALRQSLEATGAVADLRTEISADKLLVYVEPAAADASKQVACAALRGAGIDCFVIRSGHRAGALSIGVFRNPALAARQALRAGALGYPAHVVPWGARDARFNVFAWVDAAESRTGKSSDACAAIAPQERFL